MRGAELSAQDSCGNPLGFDMSLLRHPARDFLFAAGA